jgi:hypothetical protein
VAPIGYAVRMADGRFVGIWQDREFAEHVRAKQPPPHGDRVVPVYQVEPELLEALIDVCRVLSEHPDSMTVGGPLHTVFINAFAVVQAHTPPPPPLLNATEHTMEVPNG